MEARKLKKVVIKEELFTLTGDMFESILLGQLIYWQDKVNDFDKFIDEEQKRCEYNKLSFNMEKSNGWMFKKASELKDECMLNISEQTIRKYLQKLTDKGFINSRINPKYKWDRTIQYRVNINFVIDSIKQLGYDGLSGWKYTTSKNKTSNLENGDSLDNNRDSKESNGAAIPYTTNINYNTDITNKKEDTNVSKKVLFYPTEEEKSVFEEFRKKYPGAKRGLKTELDLLVKKHKDWHDVIPILNKAIDAENRKRKEAKDADSFYPNPKNLQTYINNRSWELFTDEPDYDENEYHPNTNGSDVRWNEPSQRYICFYPWAFDNLCDGYTKETRPDNATVFCQGRKYVWNKEQQKWDHD